MNTNTIKESDIFSSQAHTWWDTSGPFKALHKMNPIRIEHMLQTIHKHLGKKPLSILDVGCGGGLVCEPFARLGHHVTGVDLSSEAINVATTHARAMNLEIDYKCCNVDELNETYDVVCLLEMLEHTASPLTVLETATQRLKPGGLIFLSTLNRTFFSYAAGIVLAENILGWAPKGTHQWSRFIKPSELILPLKKLNIDVTNLTGMSWSIPRRTWMISEKLNGNYILSGVKR